MLSSVVVALSLLSPIYAAPAMMRPHRRDNTLKFAYGTEKVRGVNLGGWFVLEPWITPSIFSNQPDNVVDEYTYTQTLGKEVAYNNLYAHWTSWIVEQDFTDIAAAGLNHVRIPIGYWSVSPLDGDPYVQGAYDILGQALDWAETAGLKVMIDLHGAPGSQNGFDNSGRKGAIDWGVSGPDSSTVDETHTALNQIRDDHASHPAVAAIELVNEPEASTIGLATVQQFYMDGWGDLENSNVAITFHDGFEPFSTWESWGSGMWNLLLDTHHYEVFDQGQLAMTPTEHVQSACAFGASMAANDKWTISGEWTGAQTDCAQWLNGRGIGARYDGTYTIDGGSSYIGSCDGKSIGTVADLSADDQSNLAHFIEAQLDAYEEAAGWIFWAWKTESAPEWHLQNLTAAGLFPQPITSRKYPGQCG